MSRGALATQSLASFVKFHAIISLIVIKPTTHVIDGKLASETL